ncbi:uncharacterized protein KD926_003219 [Aspergillus affinis]|uniref:uncharacterized protein n=1 Tax=Aspergillus affinis TaxID=1070780 RepID=UPI0022FE39D8|nr:uncharacterized protein KD926_003219 [Aspergillus affinis]KAI9035590.1 hypothetical protein KD926_003219 [Aspergillus affinis]
MLQALAVAKKKLNKYYSATDNEPYGIVYAIVTILCLSKKLRYFNNKDWRGENEKGENVDFMKIYRDALQKEFERYRQNVFELVEPTDAQVSKETAEEEELAILCDLQTPLLPDVDQPDNEITRYLAKGLAKGNPRLYWKEHKHEFPVLARIAKDIFSIPANGTGIERLFNCTRDICYYRRGHLKPDTIKGLMLHLFSSKFELEHS